jgi:predicted alpha/beta-hydrolase family hydrolase
MAPDDSCRESHDANRWQSMGGRIAGLIAGKVGALSLCLSYQFHSEEKPQ